MGDVNESRPAYRSRVDLHSIPKVAVVTGGAQGIGKAIGDAFVKQGVIVCTIDLQDNDYFVGDIADEKVLRAFAFKSYNDCGWTYQAQAKGD